MIKTANFGCGVDSVAGLLKYGPESYDEIIFADTGSENPETYQYLQWLIKDKKWPITIVKNHYGKTLYDYYYDKETYPTPVFRDCTAKFKIRPLRKYLRIKYGKKETFFSDIFIDHSEFHRMKTSDVKYQVLNYPLVNDKINREQCIEIIKNAGFPIPIKSGCFMCPFTKTKNWAKLKLNHPDLFQKTMELEKRGMYKDGIKKSKIKPLIKLKAKETKDLFECSCF